MGESPFTHTYLIQSKKLRIASFISDINPSLLEEPCILIGGHPTLRLGDFGWILKSFGANEKNVVILTDPDINPELALAPYKPLFLRIIHSPVDARLNFGEANQLLARCCPKHLVLPEYYISKESYGSENGDGTQNVNGVLPLEKLLQDTDNIKYKTSVVQNLSQVIHEEEKSHFHCEISSEVAKEIRMHSANGGTAASLSASVQFERGRYVIKPIEMMKESNYINEDAYIRLGSKTKKKILNTITRCKPYTIPRVMERRKPLYGEMQAENLLVALKDAGIDDATMDKRSPDEFTIDIPSLKSNISCTRYQTSIDTQDEEHRLLLSGIIISLLYEI